MTETLKSQERNPVQVQKMMADKIHIEELLDRMTKRLQQLGITLNAIDELEREVATYYEEN